MFRACKSLDAARGQQLPRGRVGGGGEEGGTVEVAAIMSLEEDRGDERGGQYVTTMKGWWRWGGVDRNTGSRSP